LTTQKSLGGEKMASLTEKEKELVAIGTAIGAGCQICTQFHVGTAVKNGLSQDEVRWAIDEAQAVRGQGGVAVANIGRRALGVEERPPERDEQPSGRSQALVDIGAAAGCNAGALLAPYLASAQRLGVATEELRSALEISEVVKEHAAKFLRHDADKALQEVATTPPKADVTAWDCCEPTAGEEAPCG
jgi:AhpD family alkylhydroperoxidase